MDLLKNDFFINRRRYTSIEKYIEQKDTYQTIGDCVTYQQSRYWVYHMGGEIYKQGPYHNWKMNCIGPLSAAARAIKYA